MLVWLAKIGTGFKFGVCFYKLFLQEIHLPGVPAVYGKIGSEPVHCGSNTFTKNHCDLNCEQVILPWSLHHTGQFGVEQCSLVWSSVVWCGAVQFGVEQCSLVWSGAVWCGVVWFSVKWCGLVWSGAVWCEVVWFGVEWCGLVWSSVVQCEVV